MLRAAASWLARAACQSSVSAAVTCPTQRFAQECSSSVFNPRNLNRVGNLPDLLGSLWHVPTRSLHSSPSSLDSTASGSGSSSDASPTSPASETHNRRQHTPRPPLPRPKPRQGQRPADEPSTQPPRGGAKPAKAVQQVPPKAQPKAPKKTLSPPSPQSVERRKQLDGALALMPWEGRPRGSSQEGRVEMTGYYLGGRIANLRATGNLAAKLFRGAGYDSELYEQPGHHVVLLWHRAACGPGGQGGEGAVGAVVLYEWGGMALVGEAREKEELVSLVDERSTLFWRDEAAAGRLVGGRRRRLEAVAGGEGERQARLRVQEEPDAGAGGWWPAWRVAKAGSMSSTYGLPPEDHTVRVLPEMSERRAAKADDLKEWDSTNLENIARVVCQSAALRFYKDRCEDLSNSLDAILAGGPQLVHPDLYTRVFRRHAMLPEEELADLVFKTADVKRALIQRLGLGETPASAWDSDKHYGVWDRTVEEFEIDDRKADLLEKVDLVDDQSKGLLDTRRGQMGHNAEWIIIGLISVEIMLTLYHHHFDPVLAEVLSQLQKLTAATGRGG